MAIIYKKKTVMSKVLLKIKITTEMQGISNF